MIVFTIPPSLDAKASATCDDFDDELRENSSIQGQKSSTPLLK